MGSQAEPGNQDFVVLLFMQAHTLLPDQNHNIMYLTFSPNRSKRKIIELSEKLDMATLNLQNVVKTYPGGIRAVDDLSLDVADGERIVLAGPSGSGKSTTLRLIAGLEHLSGGNITLDGRAIDNLPPQKRDVAMVFQHHALYPHLNVHGNLAFGLKLRGLSKSEIDKHIADTAAMLGIADLLQRRPWELSGGQRQRVALGRAIVRRPKIFLMDEPLTHLNSALSEHMRHEIIRLQEDRLATTMLYVTHDQTEAMTIGQRIVVLDNGQVQQIAAPTTLYNRPANRFVASFIGNPSMNFFPGRIELRGNGLVYESRDGKNVCWSITPRWRAALETYGGKEIILGVRPEHLRLDSATAGEGSLKISAIVESIESLGAESYLHLRAGSLQFTCRTQSNHGVAAGERVCLAISANDLYFFDLCSEKSITYKL